MSVRHQSSDKTRSVSSVLSDPGLVFASSVPGHQLDAGRSAYEASEKPSVQRRNAAASTGREK